MKSEEGEVEPVYRQVQASKRPEKKVPAWLKSGQLKSDQLKYYRSSKSLKLATGMDR